MPDMQNILLHSIDIVVIFVMVLFTWIGYRRGFISEVFGVLSWVAGIILTVAAFPFLVNLVVKVIPDKLTANITTGLVLFIVVLAIMSYGRSAVLMIVKTSRFNPVDVYLGLFFGILKGVLVLTALYGAILLYYKDETKPDWLTSARTLPFLDYGAHVMLDFIPNGDKFREHLGPRPQTEIQDLEQQDAEYFPPLFEDDSFRSGRGSGDDAGAPSEERSWRFNPFLYQPDSSEDTLESSPRDSFWDSTPEEPRGRLFDEPPETPEPLFPEEQDPLQDPLTEPDSLF